MIIWHVCYTSFLVSACGEPTSLPGDNIKIHEIMILSDDCVHVRCHSFMCLSVITQLSRSRLHFRLHLRTFSTFRTDVRVSSSIVFIIDLTWYILLQFIFTTGLALSTTVDVIITASLFVLLQSSRTGAATSGVYLIFLIILLTPR